jgi:sugar (pentulose or hexulose) kinase
MHQADWIAARLAGKGGFSDQNNVLKTGFDLTSGCWPEWLGQLEIDRALLPKVFEPGVRVAEVCGNIASRFGFSRDCAIHAGTTDSIAAFLSTGASEPGDGVTSLGTTLVIKLIASHDVRDLASGVYSHRLGDHWLPGGASNSGGGALLRHFSLEEMERLTPMLRPDNPIQSGFYPLANVGERFPVCNPKKLSIHGPRPENDVDFFQALLEGIASVEKLAYERLAGLGAPALRRVFTAGGGASNLAWCKIRERILGVPVIACQETTAAEGTAGLVRKNWTF